MQNLDSEGIVTLHVEWDHYTKEPSMRELGPLPWPILNKFLIEWKMVGCVEDADTYHDEVGVDMNM